jgi:hypothetical protein
MKTGFSDGFLTYWENVKQKEEKMRIYIIMPKRFLFNTI